MIWRPTAINKTIIMRRTNLSSTCLREYILRGKVWIDLHANAYHLFYKNIAIRILVAKISPQDQLVSSNEECFIFFHTFFFLTGIYILKSFPEDAFRELLELSLVANSLPSPDCFREEFTFQSVFFGSEERKTFVG